MQVLLHARPGAASPWAVSQANTVGLQRPVLGLGCSVNGVNLKVVMMPQQICHGFGSPHTMRWPRRREGLLSSIANLRVSSQTLLGMRRVTVLPREGFSGLD